MPRYKVAHIREQGQDMIVVPVESTFANHSVGSAAGQRASLADMGGRGAEGRVGPRGASATHVSA